MLPDRYAADMTDISLHVHNTAVDLCKLILSLSVEPGHLGPKIFLIAYSDL